MGRVRVRVRVSCVLQFNSVQPIFYPRREYTKFTCELSYKREKCNDGRGRQTICWTRSRDKRQAVAGFGMGTSAEEGACVLYIYTRVGLIAYKRRISAARAGYENCCNSVYPLES